MVKDSSNQGQVSGVSSNTVSGSGHININTASQSELESLSGIGPVYAQKIIDNRMYSDVSELHTKDIISKSTFEKIKTEIGVY